MSIPKKAIELIKMLEGYRAIAYQCTAGRWTIGYGHTGNVKQGDKITPEKAEIFLREDLERFYTGIKNLVKVPLTENQLSASLSLVFNIGLGAFTNSTVLRMVNQSKFKEAAEAFLLFNKEMANGKLRVNIGLANRRLREKMLFIS